MRSYEVKKQKKIKMNFKSIVQTKYKYRMIQK